MINGNLRSSAVIVSAVILWAAFCFMVGNFMHGFLPAQPPFIVGATMFEGPMDPWTPFIRYDSVHYIVIADKGYHNAYYGLRAFLPGFPFTIHFLTRPVLLLTSNKLLAYVGTGLAANLAFLALSFGMIKKMFEKEFEGKNGWTAGVLLLCQPYAFYYLAFYAEALFLFLTVAAFWSALRRRWWLASILAGAASATRLQGMLLLPALLVEYLHQKQWRIRNIRADILWLGLGLWGWAAYLVSIGGTAAYLKDATAWHQRVLNWNVFYPVWLYFKTAFAGKTNYSDTVSMIMILSAAFLLIYARRRLRPAFTVYILLSMAMPMITTVVQAVGRYYGTIFPLYLAAGLLFEKRPAGLCVVLAVFGILAGICIALFTNGFWIA